MADGLLEIEGGRITAAGPAPADCSQPVTRPGAVWLPGFVDAHVHFPQTRVLGSATGPLLDWLQSTVFPEEARFRERAYASAVAEEFCGALARQGTTTAAVYSSSDPGATEVLFEAFDRWGLRGALGLTLMDRGAPEEVLLEAGAALEACEALIERWHQPSGRLRFALTPRFALSCTPALLKGAAMLAERHDLLIQTHLSENDAEIAATARAFPASAHYLGVYADHGLCHERALFAHCVHLSETEWDAMAEADAAIAHCPDSNFFLGSGCMPLRAPRSRGVRIGLGTDVGAGRSFSLRRIAAGAYDAALLTGSEADAESLLWHATLGGARAMGMGSEIGRLAPGYQADLVAIDVGEASPERLPDALVFRHDTGPVAETWVEGERVYSRVIGCAPGSATT